MVYRFIALNFGFLTSSFFVVVPLSYPISRKAQKEGKRKQFQWNLFFALCLRYPKISFDCTTPITSGKYSTDMVVKQK